MCKSAQREGNRENGLVAPIAVHIKNWSISSPKEPFPEGDEEFQLHLKFLGGLRALSEPFNHAHTHSTSVFWVPTTCQALL